MLVWLTTLTLLQQRSQIIEDTVKPFFPAWDYLPVHHVHRNHLK